jgi:hypothetical protein
MWWCFRKTSGEMEFPTRICAKWACRRDGVHIAKTSNHYSNPGGAHAVLTRPLSFWIPHFLSVGIYLLSGSWAARAWKVRTLIRLRQEEFTVIMNDEGLSAVSSNIPQLYTKLLVSPIIYLRIHFLHIRSSAPSGKRNVTTVELCYKDIFSWHRFTVGP